MNTSLPSAFLDQLLDTINVMSMRVLQDKARTDSKPWLTRHDSKQDSSSYLSLASPRASTASSIGSRWTPQTRYRCTCLQPTSSTRAESLDLIAPMVHTNLPHSLAVTIARVERIWGLPNSALAHQEPDRQVRSCAELLESSGAVYAPSVEHAGECYYSSENIARRGSARVMDQYIL